jgi:hypothetical protein
MYEAELARFEPTLFERFLHHSNAPRLEIEDPEPDLDFVLDLVPYVEPVERQYASPILEQ